MSRFLVSEKTRAQLEELIKLNNGNFKGGGGFNSPGGKLVSYVKITGDADEDGYYPCSAQSWDTNLAAWQTYGDAFVSEANGGALVTDSRYIAIRYGREADTEDANGKCVFVAVGVPPGDGGGGGGDGSSGCGWTAGLIEADCLKASTSGTEDIFLRSTDGSTWTGGTLAICETAYSVSFARGDCNGPCLTLTSGETSLTGVRASCGCGSASFAFPKRTLCPSSERGDDGPCFDTVGVSIAWTTCPIDGWGGSGYYCTITSGQDCTTDGVTRELTDPLDHTYTICSGPYDSSEDTICADNDTSDTTCCSSRGDSMPTAIYATFGGVLAWIGTVEFDIGSLVGGHQPRVYNPTGDWAATNSVCGGFVGMGSLSCNSGTGLWSFGAGFALSGSMTWTTSAVAATSCDPFTISFTGAVTRSGGEGFPTGTCTEGAGTVTFTETSP